jgi:hypothetical protein
LVILAFFELVLKVCQNRLGCHGQSVAEQAPSNLSNFGHSVTIRGPPRSGDQEAHTRASVSGLCCPSLAGY